MPYAIGQSEWLQKPAGLIKENVRPVNTKRGSGMVKSPLAGEALLVRDDV